MSGRLSREAWQALALEVLAGEGPEALTIARLCARAGRTRGSLYHHFPSRGALLDATMEAWRARNTQSLIRETPPGRGAVDHLKDLALSLDFGLEQAARRLVSREPPLAPYLRQVDEARLEHLASLHRADGASEEAARARAEIEYAVFLGMQQLDLSAERLDALYGWFAAQMSAASRAG